MLLNLLIHPNTYKICVFSYLRPTHYFSNQKKTHFYTYEVISVGTYKIDYVYTCIIYLFWTPTINILFTVLHLYYLLLI